MINDKQTDGIPKNFKIVVSRKSSSNKVKPFYSTITAKFVKTLANETTPENSGLYYLPGDQNIWVALTTMIKINQQDYGWDLNSDDFDFYGFTNFRAGGQRYEVRLNLGNYLHSGQLSDQFNEKYEQLQKVVETLPQDMPKLKPKKPMISPLLAKLMARLDMPTQGSVLGDKSEAA